MESSYKFYNNKGCHYLPCHKVNNVDEFNCMFCYCPLYFFDECGGNYKDKSGIKDCSDCLIPHSPKGMIISIKKLREQIKKEESYGMDKSC